MKRGNLDGLRVWLTVGPDPENEGQELRTILSGKYGQCVFTVKREYSGDIVARVRGGGFDMAGTGLADSLRKLYRLPTMDGGVGEMSVIEWARENGVRVENLGSALYSLAPVEQVKA